MKAWKLEITLAVADSWVADGFDAKERLEEIEECISSVLPFAYGHEVRVKVKIKSAPKRADIKALQEGALQPQD